MVKRMAMGKYKAILSLLVLGLTFFSSQKTFAQASCVPPPPASFNDYPLNTWTAYVFQLSPTYNPFNDRDNKQFLAGSAGRVFKGYLPKNADYLDPSSLEFDITFGDILNQPFFDAGTFPTVAEDGITPSCDVTRSDFGMLLRARYVIPEAGVYRFQVGSDDGSYLRVSYDINAATPVIDVNGNSLIHNNWAKTPTDTVNFDGIYNFLYDLNTRNYYAEFNGGETIYLEMTYYEKNRNNRFSFELERYFGPGEIGMLKNELGFATFCGMDPNPENFFSKSPAVLEGVGILNDYFWEYRTNESEPWVVVDGVTTLSYNIPKYSEQGADQFSGTRFYRRGARTTIGIEEVVVYSNVLEVEVIPLTHPPGGLQEYGKNEWRGYIYDGRRVFSPQSFYGLHVLPFQMNETFTPTTGFFLEKFQPNTYGCSFPPNEFTVQFLMELDVEPGTYQFTITADDGYRLFIDNILMTPTANMPLINGVPPLNNGNPINPWNRIGAAGSPTNPANTNPYSVVEFEITEPKTIRLRLDYFDATGGQQVNFMPEFSILPVEWGNISGDACGSENCLNWETVQEKNSSHFVVERSTDAREWTPVGEPVQAQGMSTQLTKYAFRDGAFLSERSYYRIRQVDLDGSVSYSDIIRVDNRNTARQMAPYPNPTTDRLRFYSQGEVRMVHLSSADTRITHSLPFTEVGPQIFEVDLSSYSNSFYVISVITNDSRQSYKVVKR